jgi:hypothetical protein
MKQIRVVMKKWMWFGLVLIVVISGLLILSSEFPFAGRQVISTNTRTDIVATPQPEVSQQLSNTPQISSDKLFAHVQNLNYKRYTQKERSQARNYISSELKKLSWKPQLQKFAGGVNIFAEHQGSDKNAGTIIVAAHYDTVANSPGADDNASGVAVLLEIARLLGSWETPRSLQLVFFDQEEVGLLGSKAFVGKIPLSKIQAAIVMDMVGYACYESGCQKYPTTLPVTPPSDQGDFLVAIADAEHSSLLSAFDQSAFKVLTIPIPLKGILTPDTLRSDHAPFWLQGIGAVLVTDTANLRSPYYHQSTDKPANIDRNFFTNAAQTVVNATTKLLEFDL